MGLDSGYLTNSDLPAVVFDTGWNFRNTPRRSRVLEIFSITLVPNIRSLALLRLSNIGDCPNTTSHGPNSAIPTSQSSATDTIPANYPVITQTRLSTSWTPDPSSCPDRIQSTTISLAQYSSILYRTLHPDNNKTEALVSITPPKCPTQSPRFPSSTGTRRESSAGKNRSASKMRL